jgi:hypothetical protein
VSSSSPSTATDTHVAWGLPLVLFGFVKSVLAGVGDNGLDVEVDAVDIPRDGVLRHAREELHHRDAGYLPGP